MGQRWVIGLVWRVKVRNAWLASFPRRRERRRGPTDVQMSRRFILGYMTLEPILTVRRLFYGRSFTRMVPAVVEIALQDIQVSVCVASLTEAKNCKWGGKESSENAKGASGVLQYSD